MQELSLKSDDIGIIPIYNIQKIINKDLFAIMELGIDNNKLINIVQSYSDINNFILYLFLEQCNDIYIKKYLIERFTMDDLFCDIKAIKDNYYSDNLYKVVKKYNMLKQLILEEIKQINETINLKKNMLEIEESYFEDFSDYEYFDNYFIRIMYLDNNVDEINKLVIAPYFYNDEFKEFDKKLENIISYELKKIINIKQSDLFFMFNKIVSSMEWINLSEEMKNRIMNEIEVFSNKLNIEYTTKEMTIFSKSKIKMLNDKYLKD